jgi:hypothetical protein
MSCNCGSIEINNGGTPGRDGLFGGYSSAWTYDNNSVASNVPQKYIRFNNASMASVTAIYLSTRNKDNNEVTDFLDSFNDSGVFGKIRVFKESDSNKFAYFTVTGISTPVAGVRALTVTFEAATGSFSAADSLVVSYSPKGATGAAGAAGAAGSNGTNGTNGTNGLYGGFSLPWKFETSTSAGATSDYLRLNNGTYSNVDHIYVSTTNSDSVASTAFLTALSNSGLFGYVKIAKKTDGTKFWMGKLIGSSVPGAYYDFTVEYIFSNSSFSANDELFLTFTPAYNISDSAFLFVGKLPSFNLVAGFELSDGQIIIPGTTGGDISVLEDPLGAFDTTTGIWTCPTTGYYDINFLINTNQNGADLGTGFYFAGIADSASGNTIAAYDTKTLATNMREGILQSSYTYRKMTAGDTYSLWFLNRSNNNITGNANGAGGNPSQSVHITIKRVA